MGGVVMWDTTNIFISHASTPFAIPEWMTVRYLVEYEVKQAVRDYLINPSQENEERCIAACRQLVNLSDEDWDALEPLLVEQIEVLSTRGPR